MHMTDTWTNRDLPVLHAIMNRVEATNFQTVQATVIAQDTNFDAKTVNLALEALSRAQPGFFEKVTSAGVSGGVLMVSGPTERARIATGTWPSPKSISEDLIAALHKQAEQTPEGPKRKKLRSMANAATDVGTDLLAKLFAEVMKSGMPPLS